MKIWECKIGQVDESQVPSGGDAPLREAVEEAYKKLTGDDNIFCFSGWGAQLDGYERDIVEGKDNPSNPFVIVVEQGEISRLWSWTVKGGLEQPLVSSHGHVSEETCRKELDMVRRAFLYEVCDS